MKRTLFIVALAFLYAWAASPALAGHCMKMADTSGMTCQDACVLQMAYGGHDAATKTAPLDVPALTVGAVLFIAADAMLSSAARDVPTAPPRFFS